MLPKRWMRPCVRAMKTEKEKSVHTNHRARIRKRYREQGLDAFAEHEVLELLLYYAYPRCDTNPIAHKMLGEFGSLHNLLDTDVTTLMARLSCSENIAILLNLIPALANRYNLSKYSKKTILDNEKIAAEYAINLFLGHTVERFYVLCMDMKRRLNKASLISQGTLNEAAVYPREVVREALANRASCVILAHNHPGGSMRPSRADLEVTRRIVDGLAFIGVDVLDHIIVMGETYYSFAARGQHVAGY